MKPLALARYPWPATLSLGLVSLVKWRSSRCPRVTEHQQPGHTLLRWPHVWQRTSLEEALGVWLGGQLATSWLGIWDESLNVPEPQFSSLYNGANEPCLACFADDT